MDKRTKLRKQGATTVSTHYMITKKNRPKMTKLFYGKENKDNNSITTAVDLLPQLDSCIKTTCMECNIKWSIQDKDMDIKALTNRFWHGQYKAGMIVGDYADYLTHITSNHIESGRSLSGNVVVFDGHDGAVHVLSTNN